MSMLLARKKVLGGTEETTSGTAAAVTAALVGTVIYDAEMVPDDFYGDGKRMPNGLYLGTYDAARGLQTGTLKFKQELRNGDKFVAMLTGAGFLLNTGVYKPTSVFASRKTWTFALFEDGRKKILHGCAGQCRISGQIGQRVFAEWEWKGIWNAPTDVAMPALAPINTTPYICRGLTLTVGGASLPLVSQFDLDLGNAVESRESLEAASGVSHFYIGEREPKCTLDPEARLIATHDAFGLLLAGTTGALSIVLTGDAGDTLTIGAPRVQRTSVGTAARGSKMTDPITLALNASSGDDELSFTEVIT